MKKLIIALLILSLFAPLAFANNNPGDRLKNVTILYPSNGTVNITNVTVPIRFYIAGNLTFFNATNVGHCALYLNDSINSTVTGASNATGFNVTFMKVFIENYTSTTPATNFSYTIYPNASTTYAILGENRFNASVQCCARINASASSCVNSSAVTFWINMIDPRVSNLTVNDTVYDNFINNRSMNWSVDVTADLLFANVTVEGTLLADNGTTYVVAATPADLKTCSNSCSCNFTATATSLGGRTNTTTGNATYTVVPCVNISSATINVTVLSETHNSLVFQLNGTGGLPIELIMPARYVNASMQECPYTVSNVSNYTLPNVTNASSDGINTCKITVVRTGSEIGNITVKYDPQYSAVSPSQFPPALALAGIGIICTIIGWASVAVFRRAT